MIPVTSDPVNLGVKFQMKLSNAKEFVKAARGIRGIEMAARRSGLLVDGDWRGAIRYLQTMPDRLEINIDRAFRQMAVMYAEDLKGAWETQSLIGTWRPLETNYLAGKVAQGLDSRTLIASKTALDSISVKFQNGGQAHTLELDVGVTATDPNGLPYMLLQEFGNPATNLPSRLLAGPVFFANEHRYIAVLVKAIRAALNNKMYPDYARGALV